MERGAVRMESSGGIVNIGELTKPATVLVEKISDAVGGIFRPYQIRRIAEAEAHAEKVKAVSQIEISELQHRAMRRFFCEEANKQQNIESIAASALPQLSDAATPENLEDDWIINLFDKCRLISDEGMQVLWSRILAGEANAPGRFSKRTINLLSSLDKSDAELFRSLCSFNWWLGNFVPLVFDVNDPIYSSGGISFNTLIHLDEVGLISFEAIAGFRRARLPQKFTASYYGREIVINFPRPEDNDLRIGTVLLSKVGQELGSICDSAPLPEFFEYSIDRWRSLGVTVESAQAPSREEGRV
ncbi:MAG: DUF2806 domain-containing protein [Bryobacteraceae bacterium]